MGCCASGRPQPNPGQQKADNNQPTVDPNANKPHTATSVNHPSQPNLYVPTSAKYNASNISHGDHTGLVHQNSYQANRSGVVGGSNAYPNQGGRNSGIKGTQQISSFQYGKEYDSKIQGNNASHFVSQYAYTKGHVTSQLQNENDRLVELDHVKELSSHFKANMGNSRVNEKIHGEEQVLQTYHQNFEIPIFEVALTAH